MSIVYDRKSKVVKVRKRPKKNLVQGQKARLPFGDQHIKELEIPEVYDGYNHNKLGVDMGDQLASSNSGRRRIRRGA